MTKPDPIAAALDAAPATGYLGGTSSIDRHFGERSEVLESVKAAHARGVPKTEIARLLTDGAPEGVVITDGMVKTWLDKNRPKTPSLQR